MPQLDFADYAPQLVWLAITFTVLYFIMARVALPRIAGVLDERDRKVQSDLERAEKLRAEAEEALATYQQTMAEARAKAQGELRTAAATIAAQTSAREGELAAKIAKQSDAAERSIAAAKQAAVGDLQKVAAELAGAMAIKLAGVRPGGTAESVVADVMRERR
jgi:F-type H+-transporting ATPase subunit b